MDAGADANKWTSRVPLRRREQGGEATAVSKPVTVVNCPHVLNAGDFMPPPRRVQFSLVVANMFNGIGQIGWDVFGFGMNLRHATCSRQIRDLHRC